MTVIALPTASPSDNAPDLLSLSDFEPFKDLSAPVLQSVKDLTDVRDYKKGETLVSQGQYEGDVFFIVAKGDFNVTTMNPQSGAIMVDKVSAGETIGLSIALSTCGGDISSNMTINAQTDGRVYVVDSEQFKTIIENRPSLAKTMLFYLADKVVVNQFTSIEFNAAPEQKIYKTLLDMVERDDVSGAWHIPNLPKHRALAELADVEEEEAAGAIAILIQNGIAKRQYPGLVVEDMQRLNRLAR